MADDLGKKAYALEPVLNPNADRISWQEWKRSFWLPQRKMVIDSLRTYHEEFNEIFPRQLQVHLSGFFGILCLSENHESLLMWAHYAKGHTGFVLEFDPDQEPFYRERGEVAYLPDRPTWKRPSRDFDKSIFFTKSPEWRYEKEHRVLRNFTELEQHPLHGTSGRNGYFAKLPESSIKAVYFGCRMENGTITEVLDILKRPTYRHVKAFLGLPAKDSFRLNFSEGDQTGLIDPSVVNILTKIFGVDYSGIKKERSK
ncbi:MAG: DUF2971 domain-containing protein [Verrucomicrobia bacterium]|nr:DUF2971 domain-containing protein [Verrucomicrobiota bacterium]